VGGPSSKVKRRNRKSKKEKMPSLKIVVQVEKKNKSHRKKARYDGLGRSKKQRVGKIFNKKKKGPVNPSKIRGVGL